MVVSVARDDFLTILAGVADALLFGAPSAAVAGMLQEKYNISEANARQLIATLQSQVNNDRDELEKLKNKAYSEYALMMEYPGFSKVYELLDKQRHNTSIRINELSQSIKEGEEKVRAAEAEADLAAAKHDTSFAGVTRKYLKGDEI